jgi:transporter family-2 protein
LASAFALLALAGGAALSVQGLVNARLAKVAGGPVWAAAISFFFGVVALVAYQLLTRAPAPPLRDAAAGPAWLWAGGFLGAFYVAGSVASISRLGPAPLVALVVLGQISAALALGHFGILTDVVQPVTPLKMLGAALLVAGVVLILRP